MAILQGACVAILGIYLARRLRTGPGERRAALRRLGLLALASWVGEDSLIRAYGFYRYDAGWALFVDQVPLLIVCIWPVVVDSAWRLAGHLVRGPRAAALLGGCLVLTDAALIEPIAVAAGLWSWTEPGLFGVPPIGILGWGVFAAGAIALLEHRRVPWWLAVLAPPLLAHAVLTAAWWGLLRWVSAPLPGWAAAAAAWAVAAPLAAWLWRRRLRVPVGELMVRLPGAGFFFTLLALSGGPVLGAYALAFVPPYLALMNWALMNCASPSAAPEGPGST